MQSVHIEVHTHLDCHPAKTGMRELTWFVAIAEVGKWESSPFQPLQEWNMVFHVPGASAHANRLWLPHHLLCRAAYQNPILTRHGQYHQLAVKYPGQHFSSTAFLFFVQEVGGIAHAQQSAGQKRYRISCHGSAS